MRIKNIELSWFRGAADKSILGVEGKSAVVYGDNGSGKSSFVDAFEYIITRGRIQHLRSEHASRIGQKNCVRNIETANDLDAMAKVLFMDDSFISTIIPNEGNVTYQSNPATLVEGIQKWNRQSHILRQDEIAEFIKNTKSEKYSALTPLLGLQEYEEIYRNITKLERSIKNVSKLTSLTERRDFIKFDLNRIFGSLEKTDIIEVVGDKLIKYALSYETDLETSSSLGARAIQEIIRKFDPEIRRFIKIRKLNEINLQNLIQQYIALTEGAEEVVTQFIDNKISILEEAEGYLELEELGDVIECPVCGTELKKDDIREHVRSELATLTELRSIHTRISKKKREITIELFRFKSDLRDDEVQQWFDLPENAEIKRQTSFLLSFKLSDERTRWGATDIHQLEKSVMSLNTLLSPFLEKEPPSIVNLQQDLELFEKAPNVFDYEIYKDKISKITKLCDALTLTQQNLRKKIVEITDTTLEAITSDIQELWKKLHPGDLIEEIILEKSASTDTGIEIILQFHGKTQPSPLLTLSEGHRNSLGLCVFISLAKQEPDNHPIILDDIVSSLDREHRGFIVDVLNEDLEDRQVILFTHDREWYDELKRRLSRRTWKFYDIKKWVNPLEGIQISPTHFTFDQARQYLPDHTNASGNACRAIMDDEYAHICEKLEVSLQFRRGPSNDHRTWKDFSHGLVSEGNRQLQILDENGEYQRVSEPIDAIRESQQLLETWANRSSHGGQITNQEVMRMIDVCERAIQFFYSCPNCERPLWHAKSSREAQCRCGMYRWRF